MRWIGRLLALLALVVWVLAPSGTHATMPPFDLASALAARCGTDPGAPRHPIHAPAHVHCALCGVATVATPPAPVAGPRPPPILPAGYAAPLPTPPARRGVPAGYRSRAPPLPG